MVELAHDGGLHEEIHLVLFRRGGLVQGLDGHRDGTFRSHVVDEQSALANVAKFAASNHRVDGNQGRIQFPGEIFERLRWVLVSAEDEKMKRDEIQSMQGFNQSTTSINQSINQRTISIRLLLINQSIDQSINQSIDRSMLT